MKKTGGHAEGTDGGRESSLPDGRASGGDRVILVYAFLPEGTDGKSMSRAAWRMAVSVAAAEYKVSPEALARDEGPHGKPFFSGHPEICFNISHSGRCIACAFASGAVGLDVQVRTGRGTDRIARRVLDRATYESYLAAADREDFFYRSWVRLESRLKRTGEGFSVELDKVEMDGCFSFPVIGEGYYAAINTAGAHTLVLRKLEGTDMPAPSQEQ